MLFSAGLPKTFPIDALPNVGGPPGKFGAAPKPDGPPNPLEPNGLLNSGFAAPNIVA